MFLACWNVELIFLYNSRGNWNKKKWNENYALEYSLLSVINFIYILVLGSLIVHRTQSKGRNKIIFFRLVLFSVLLPKNRMNPSYHNYIVPVSMDHISRNKGHRGQLRYQSIELIQTKNLLSHRIHLSILTEVAGLQSEKMPKRGT